ncbi:NAD-dependent histone deacetylase sir2 [Dimargaris verticillata]|uniref:NAD-dependent histone deacetylase sir2 n=1 Tax=Dimargaris verticillata TaxID=2761393 RepID=A0A9W8B391_9FUNG|nr:NAD-dependent histone deacetylase sir2 [Dimargaris verticillata]
MATSNQPASVPPRESDAVSSPPEKRPASQAVSEQALRHFALGATVHECQSPRDPDTGESPAKRVRVVASTSSNDGESAGSLSPRLRPRPTAQLVPADPLAASMSDQTSDVDVESSRPVSPATLAMDGDGIDAYFSEDEKHFLRLEARDCGLFEFIDRYVVDQGLPVRALLSAFSSRIAADLPATASDLDLLPLLRLTVARFLRHRDKLATLNTVEDVVALLAKTRRIMILTGAGISVSCGIPDFRSPNGIYARLGQFGLDDPQQMFDIECFSESPNVFYSFARELYPSNFQPSPSHRFIRLVETRGQLLRNYTQNIDTLEQQARIERVIQCHGSFATASCIRCGYQVSGDAIKDDIFAQRVPQCTQCQATAAKAPVARPRAHRWASDNDEKEEEDNHPPGIMKPDITFFGENLPRAFEESFLKDREQVDLLLVMGSSLKVAPVSEVMAQLPSHIPQVLVNKTPNLHMNFDVQLLGDCDGILAYLCHQLGWDLTHDRLPGGSVLSPAFAETVDQLRVAPRPMATPAPGTDSAQEPADPLALTYPTHWHLFQGAEVTAKDLSLAHTRYPPEWFDLAHPDP